MTNRTRIEKQHKIVREAIQDLFDTWNNSFSDDDMIILGGILQDVQRIMEKAIKQLSEPVEGQKQKKHSTGSWEREFEKLKKEWKKTGYDLLWEDIESFIQRKIDQAYEKGLKDKEKDYNEEWANVAYKTKWFNDLVEKQIDQAVKEREMLVRLECGNEAIKIKNQAVKERDKEWKEAVGGQTIIPFTNDNCWQSKNELRRDILNKMKC